MAAGGSMVAKIDSLADNAFLKVIGRVGMALAIPAFGLFASYLGNQSAAIANVSAKVDTVATDTNEKVEKVSGRIDVIDTRINIGQKARETFQDQMTATTAQILQQQSLLLTQNASIAATLSALVKQVDGIDARSSRNNNGVN